MGQSLGRAALIAKHPQIPRGRSQRVTDPSERQQPGIRVRLVGEPAEHDRKQSPLDRSSPAETTGELSEMAHRARGVTKTQRCQTLSRGLRGQPRLGAAQPGSCDQQWAVEEPLMEPSHLARLLLPLRDNRR
jgi:hypothetical protein